MNDKGLSQTGSLSPFLKRRQRLRTIKNNELPQAGVPAGTSVQCPTNPLRRILVVDDEPYIRQLSTEVLIHSGYDVDAAEDGATAWEALQVNNYNLLITEHSIPRLTGVELVRKLRAARMDLPVVLAAARLPTEALARNPSLQLAAMLLKPFTVEELLGTVTKVLRATDSPREQLETPPDLRSQPSAVGLLL